MMWMWLLLNTVAIVAVYGRLLFTAYKVNKLQEIVSDLAQKP